MRSGRRTLHADTPMPGSVHRRHEDPDTSDNFGHILRAAAEPVGADGVIATDTNEQAFWSTRQRCWVRAGAHWRRLSWNGYTRMKRRFLPGTRRMTAEELRREEWTWEQARRARRPNGERLRTDEELVTFGVLHGVVLIVEEKHPAFRSTELAREAVAVRRRHDHPAWFMVLISLEPRGKVAAMRQAGGQIALIFGHDPVVQPAHWADWEFYPNQIWGPDNAKRWIA